MTSEFLFLPLTSIDESPLNHRQHFGDLSELAASIEAKGVLQPGLARPKGKRYELVYGHRRLRAAKLAGLKTFPVIVRDLTDVEVVEAQVVENGQRVDVHPLEEADGYEQLHQVHGYSVEQIAAKTGKSASYVYGRLKLRELGEDARRLFFAGSLTIQTALLVARISNPTLREKAAREVGGDTENFRLPMRANTAADHIQRLYMLELADAEWDLDDAKLVKSAGACTTCPKRSGAQPALFADLEDDHCTDPDCWEAKSDALVKLVIKKAKAAGAKVLSEKQVDEIFPNTWSNRPSYESGYIRLDDPCNNDPDRRTWRTLLGDSYQAPVVADVRGKVIELVQGDDIPRLLKEAGVALEPPKAVERKTQAAPPPRKLKPVERAIDAAFDAAYESAASVSFTTALAWCAADLAAGYGGSDFKQYGLNDATPDSMATLGDALPMFAIRLLLRRLADEFYVEPSEDFIAAMAVVGVDFPALLAAEEAADEAELAAAKPAKGRGKAGSR